jgi:hypothetical protein
MGLSARNFEASKTSITDNLSDSAIATAIETWPDGLGIGTTHTVYEITIEHYAGFWHCILVYEP